MLIATPTDSRPSRFGPTQQIFAALAVGVLLGWLMPHLPATVRSHGSDTLLFFRETFLRAIKLMIAPLVFASVVQGIVGTGDVKKVGRIGFKALIYFEVVTTVALVFGLVIVNLIRPGEGVSIVAAEAAGNISQGKAPGMLDTLIHIVPVSIIDAMARNDVLQTVFFSVAFALSIIACGESARPVIAFCEALTQVMFRFANLVMKFAPLGICAAIALTVAGQGTGVLLTLGKLVLTVYIGLAAFVLLVFGGIILALRIPLRRFIAAVREPSTIAFATASSEAALPQAFDRMRKFGVPSDIVGFVIPAGYTFNLDGSAIYLSVAAVFVAQAAQTAGGFPPFGIAEQISMLLMLMITSKGIAAVPRASLVVLIATLSSFHLPVEGALMILGVDAIMDMGRTAVNVIGNCLAAVVVAKWEKAGSDPVETGTHSSSP